jgi:transposase
MSFVCNTSIEKVLMKQERVTLSKNELKRVKVLERVLGGCMTSTEAAASLGVTCRQLRRLKNKYSEKGESGLIHGNRGKKSAHALPEELKKEVQRLFDEKYSDSNFCHCSQLLQEHEGIVISASSVGRILKSAGKEAKNPKKRRLKKHRPRARRKQAGMLWQIDATPYEWLGNDFGKFALHAAIDDATGIVVGAWFTPNERLEGFCEVMKQGVMRYGVPLALYSDKHTIFRSPDEKLTLDEELDGQTSPLSNFGKAMAELDVEHIKASTPQAKGRVERLWKTFQDRLPVELRLLGIKDIQGANKCLPKLLEKHNSSYSVLPADVQDAYRLLESDVNLDCVFALRETRKIGSGCEIRYKNEVYVPKDCGYILAARTTVEVRESFSGEVFLWHKGKVVKLKKIERTKEKEQSTRPETKRTEQTPYKPAIDHPWRKNFLNKGQSVQKNSWTVAAS